MTAYRIELDANDAANTMCKPDGQRLKQGSCESRLRRMAGQVAGETGVRNVH